MDRKQLTDRQTATRWVSWMIVVMWGMFFAAPTNAQTITVSPTSLDFGSVVQFTSSTAQTIRVNNTGNRTMNIGTVNITGNNTSSFAFTKTCTNTLGAGRNCTISVTFRPQAQGALSARLNISTNATNAVGGLTTIALTGTGLPPLPVLVVSPTSIAFGSVALNTLTGPRAVVISNTGAGVLNFTSATISTQTSGAGFNSSTTCGATVSPGASCVVNVTFQPTLTGAKTGTLAIRTNGSPATFNVALTGTGTTPTPILALSPTRATLTCATPYGGPVYTSIAASNTGTATVTLGAISFGAGASFFSQTNDCGGSVAVGSACNIAVKYTPTGRTQRTATMTVNSDGGNRTVSLTGSCRSHPSP